MVVDLNEMKKTIMELESKLTKEHLERGDIPMPDGSWKSQKGNSRYEYFIREKLRK